MAKDVLPFVFLDIALVIVVARLVGRLFVRFRQPAVIGEIVGGIVLGPSVLGLLPGNLPQVLFPADVRPHLTVIAQLGLVLFMFIVGLEVDLRLIQSRRRVATTVSLSSIAAQASASTPTGVRCMRRSVRIRASTGNAVIDIAAPRNSANASGGTVAASGPATECAG